MLFRSVARREGRGLFGPAPKIVPSAYQPVVPDGVPPDVTIGPSALGPSPMGPSATGPVTPTPGDPVRP